jgi:hypothetical protein
VDQDQVSEDNPGQQFPEHRRLIQPLEEFASDLGGGQYHNQREERRRNRIFVS